MRGGTSKGVFFLSHDLPQAGLQRDRVIQSALGSPDAYERQMDGLGGATSSTSKAVILSPSTREDCDVDYLFAHVDVASGVVDYTGTCANLSAAVGLYAIEHDLVKGDGARTGEVRVWQVNLQQRFIVRVPLNADLSPQTVGDYAVAGVTGSGARIAIEFPQPVPAAIGAVLPSARATDSLRIPGLGAIEVSLVAAGNATVFIEPESLGIIGDELATLLNSMPEVLARAELIRAAAAVKMGLVSSLREASARLATPKIAVVSAPRVFASSAGETVRECDMDICVRMFSMGKAHHAITASGAIALAVACHIPGTLPHRYARRAAGTTLRLGHCAGVMEVDAKVTSDHNVAHATIYRTARSLMRGHVLVPVPQLS